MNGTRVMTSNLGNSDTLIGVIEAINPAVGLHGRRVSAYSVRLAMQYGLPSEMVETIRVGALLHDAGKLLIPPRLLTKPGRLTKREWNQLRSHPELGSDLVKRLGFTDEVAEVVLYHHEHPDGSGYPDGLTAHAVAWPVRIVSVMDAFDALTSPRAYRQALSFDAARSLLAREAGTRFCPWVVAGLLSLPRPLLEPARGGALPLYVPDGCPTQAAAEANETWAVALRA